MLAVLGAEQAYVRVVAHEPLHGLAQHGEVRARRVHEVAETHRLAGLDEETLAGVVARAEINGAVIAQGFWSGRRSGDVRHRGRSSGRSGVSERPRHEPPRLRRRELHQREVREQTGVALRRDDPGVRFLLYARVNLLRGEPKLVIDERPTALVHVQKRVDVRRTRARDACERVRVDTGLLRRRNAVDWKNVRPILLPALEIHARVPAARVDVGPKRARRARRVPGQARLLWPRGGARFRTRGRKSARVFPAEPRGAPRLVEHRRVAFEHVAVARPAVRAQVAPRVVRAHAARRGERNRRERAAGGLLWPSLAFSGLLARVSGFLGGTNRRGTFRRGTIRRGFLFWRRSLFWGLEGPPQRRRRSRSALEIAPLELAPHRDLLLLLLELGVQAAPQPARVRHLAERRDFRPRRGEVRGEVRVRLARQALDPVHADRRLRHALDGDVQHQRDGAHAHERDRGEHAVRHVLALGEPAEVPPRALSTGHRPGAPARVPEQTRLLRRRRLRRRRRRRGGRKADALRARHPVSRLVHCGERTRARDFGRSQRGVQPRWNRVFRAKTVKTSL